jgi:Protein of unknown function (DUF1207)
VNDIGKRLILRVGVYFAQQYSPGLEEIMKRFIYLWYWGVGLCCQMSVMANAATSTDAYIAGYAAAVLEQTFHVSSASLQVQDGELQLKVEDLTGVDQDQLMKALLQIRGVRHVELRRRQQLLASTSGNVASAPAPALRQHGQAVETEIAGSESAFLPEGYLFDQLIADLRWPHFSIAYRYYINDKQLANTGSANFGETFALYRNRFPFGGLWEFGLQAGVFSLFDLDAPSKDLINADYLGGIYAGYRYEQLAALLRVFHQSSHLGDEFVLRNRANRINLSYEQVDLKASYKFFNALRIYGGGGYLFDQDPSNLAPWLAQYGVEFTSPWRFANDNITPIFAADFKNEEENNWSTNLSLQGGVQFENWRLGQRRLQLLVEYFHGHSPNGQFYTRKIETIGLGAHLRF